MAVFAGKVPTDAQASAWQAAQKTFAGSMVPISTCSACRCGTPGGADRGAAFGPDHQQPFFDDWLRWAGISDITTIRFQPNLATADADTGRRIALAQARDAGKTF